jgi:ribonuclease G
MSVEQIIIRDSPGETISALLSGGRLVEILIDRVGRESLVGNIYLGRIKAVHKSLDAAFVKIDKSEDGFLALPEIRPVGEVGRYINDYVKEGEAVLVQVQRDSVEDKGVKLTKHIHLAGAFLVFRPYQIDVNLSRNILDKDQRRRLKEIVSKFASKEGGFIIRTNAKEGSDKEIENEAIHLISCWRKITKDLKTASPPSRIFSEVKLSCQALRNFGNRSLREIIVDGTDSFCRISNYCASRLPWLTARISSYKGSSDIFEVYGITEKIEIALSTKVSLVGGGFLIINQTPALCSIDVNTGSAKSYSQKQTAFDVNFQAASEIALQIRLRNISGLIIIDFVSLKDAGRKKIILDLLKKAANADPVGMNIAGFTRLGLVEMTRQRHGLSLHHIVSGLEMPEVVKSSESQAIDSLRQVMSEVRSSAHISGVANVLLRAPKRVVAVLEGKDGERTTATIALDEAQSRLGLAIKLEVNQNLSDGQCEVIVSNGKK